MVTFTKRYYKNHEFIVPKGTYPNSRGKTMAINPVNGKIHLTKWGRGTNCGYMIPDDWYLLPRDELHPVLDLVAAEQMPVTSECGHCF